MTDRDPINGQEVTTEAELTKAKARWEALRAEFPGRSDRQLTELLRKTEGRAWIERRILFELQAAGGADDEEISTIKIDRSDAQLTREEELEIVDACGDVRDAVRKLHTEAIALSRHIDRGNRDLRREKMEEIGRALKNQYDNFAKALRKIPFTVTPALLVIGCMLLAGCGSKRDAVAPDTAKPCPTCRAL